MFKGSLPAKKNGTAIGSPVGGGGKPGEGRQWVFILLYNARLPTQISICVVIHITLHPRHDQLWWHWCAEWKPSHHVLRKRRLCLSLSREMGIPKGSYTSTPAGSLIGRLHMTVRPVDLWLSPTSVDCPNTSVGSYRSSHPGHLLSLHNPAAGASIVFNKLEAIICQYNMTPITSLQPCQNLLWKCGYLNRFWPGLRAHVQIGLISGSQPTLK